MDEYFLYIKNDPDPYLISKAQNITIQLILFSCLKIDDKSIKDSILSYTVEFFKNYYKNGIAIYNSDFANIINILSLISRYLPLIWDLIFEAVTEMNLNLEELLRSLK